MQRRAAAPAVPRALPAAVAVLLLVLCSCGGSSVKNEPALAAVQANADTNASGSVGSVEVQDAWISPPPGRAYPPGSSFAVGMILENNGSSWDSLTSVSSPAAARATLSEFNIVQDFISLTTDPKRVDATAQFDDINRSIAPGDRVPVTFHFDSAGSVTLQVPVRAEPKVGIGGK